MDILVFKKFDLKRNQLNKELEQELAQIKSQLVARNAYHSGASIKIQCDAIIKNCSLKLDALIKVYEEIENEVEQGYIVKNEANIRKEFNEILSSEYSACDHRIVRIYSEFKVVRNDIHTFQQIRQEAEARLDILIESVKRRETKKQSTQAPNLKEEYKILKEEFEYQGERVIGEKYKYFVIMPMNKWCRFS